MGHGDILGKPMNQDLPLTQSAASFWPALDRLCVPQCINFPSPVAPTHQASRIHICRVAPPSDRTFVSLTVPLTARISI